MAMNSSVRLQAYFTSQLYHRLQEEAHRRGKSIAQMVREAVEQYLDTLEQETADPNDPLWRIPALAAKYPGSGLPDAAVRHDDYLYDKKGIA
ncbi:MAG: ribbon-helix-helix protein, CopG family [Chloroflexi bacterium]|nr:ribbon-helix-helix protein, CopG family [Chloroflexota bacterium]